MNGPVGVLDSRLHGVNERIEILNREIEENNIETLNKKGIIVEQELLKKELEDAILILKTLEANESTNQQEQSNS